MARPQMSETEFLAALGHLDDASAMLGHIPATAVHWLACVLARRDDAARALADQIAGDLLGVTR